MVTKGHIFLNKSDIKGLKYKCFEKRDKFLKKTKKNVKAETQQHFN